MSRSRNILLASTSVILVLVAFLAICATIIRLYVIAPYPFYQGGGMTSPDGQFMASIRGVYDETFWGRKSEYYQIAIYYRKAVYPDGTNHKWETYPRKKLIIQKPDNTELRMYRGSSPFPCRWLENGRFEVDFFSETIIVSTKE